MSAVRHDVDQSVVMALKQTPDGTTHIVYHLPVLESWLLRALAVRAGCHAFTTRDDVFCASRGLLLLHASYTGGHVLRFPPRTTGVRDLIRDRPVALGGGALRLDLRPAGEGPLARARAEHTVREGGRVYGFHSAEAGRVRWLVGGGFEQTAGWFLSDGFSAVPTKDGGRRTNADDRLGHLLAKGAVDVAPGHTLSAFGGYVDRVFGVPPTTAPGSQPRRWRFTSWRAGLAGLRWQGRVAPQLRIESSLWLTRFTNTLDSYDDETYTTRSAGTFHSTYDELALGGDALLALDPLSVAVGHLDGALRLETFWQRHGHVEDRGEPEEVAATVRLAALPEVRYEVADGLRVTVQGGVEAEIPREATGVAPPDPTVGWRFLAGIEGFPHPQVRLEAGAAHSLRLPSLKERYSRAMGARTAAPNLAPEEGWLFHAAASWRPVRWLTASVTGFDAELEDLIQNAVVGQGVQQLRNVGRARFAGVEAGLAVAPWDFLELRAAYAWLHMEKLSAGGDELTHRPAHRVVAEVRVGPWAGLELTALWTLTGAQDSQDPFRSEMVRLGMVQQLDLVLGWRPLDAVSLWVRATNVLDSNHSFAWGYPEPGRAVTVGLEVAGGRGVF